jgi:hypothetical protein
MFEEDGDDPYPDLVPCDVTVTRATQTHLEFEE